MVCPFRSGYPLYLFHLLFLKKQETKKDTASILHANLAKTNILSFKTIPLRSFRIAVKILPLHNNTINKK